MFKTFILSTLFFIVLSTTHSVYASDNAEDVMQKCQNKRPEWYQCQTDADCTVSLDPCGWPVLGVNKIHKGRSEICTRQAGAFIDCPMWKNTPQNRMSAICTQGICTAIRASEIKKTAPQKQSDTGN